MVSLTFNKNKVATRVINKTIVKLARGYIIHECELCG
jgi:hypothetical protein